VSDWSFVPKPAVNGQRHLSGTGTVSIVNQLRRLQMRNTDQVRAAAERCDFCAMDVPSKHRHVLDTQDRRIMCACEMCFVRLADQGRYRPTGTRIVSLPEFRLSDELWARFAIPVGLAFFFHSSVAEQVVAMYPSPLGATESELDMSAWEELIGANPLLESLEPDAEALLVNRMIEPTHHLIVPIDKCYELVGLVKQSWHGISGGSEADEAIESFFEGLMQEAGDEQRT
jgi:Family of unknown function (DUF5947)